MEFKNCSKCGKMFNYFSGEVLCEKCKKDLEESFQKVKAFVEENPHAGLREISEACEVSTKQLKQWVLEERLMFTEGSPIQLTCENCGARIMTGRFCAKCKGEVTSGLNSAVKQRQKAIAELQKKQMQAKADSKSGMRFIST